MGKTRFLWFINRFNNFRTLSGITSFATSNNIFGGILASKDFGAPNKRIFKGFLASKYLDSSANSVVFASCLAPEVAPEQQIALVSEVFPCSGSEAANSGVFGGYSNA